jgi:hypothetical protein
MDAFLLSYGLDPVEAHRLFAETGTIFSGSSALALYLNQEGVEAGFEPNDMDLWLDGSHLEGGEANVELLLDFFVRSRYYMARETRQADVYMENLTRIHRIITVESHSSPSSPFRKTIQLIVVRPMGGQSVYDYIANQFDFSACMTWWDAEFNRFHTMYPKMTKAKQMFIRKSFLSSIQVERAKERLEKYLSRGFIVVEEPPPFWSAPDERGEEDMVAWEGVKAFDVWSYEEVEATEHLRAGDWMILVGCGGAWYAFDRRPLITYMEEHGGVIARERGVLYDTPYRQTVIYDAWDALAYSDYSIYELVEPEDITVRVKGREETKTLYGVRAYTVAGWRVGEADYTVGKQTEMREVEEVEAVEEEVIQRIQEILAVEEAIPIPDIPLPVVAAPMSSSVEELYRQLMDWIQVEP